MRYRVTVGALTVCAAVATGLLVGGRAAGGVLVLGVVLLALGAALEGGR